MRDPGIPRRNPLFDHTFDGSEDGSVPFVGAPDGAPEPHLRAIDDGGWSDDFAWDDDPFASGERDATAADPLAGVSGLVAALAEAQPEAVEHLVTAAHEVVLAVKSVVDAAEVALAAQRADLAAQREAREAHRDA